MRAFTYGWDNVRRKRLDSSGTIHYLGLYERNAGNGADTTEVITKYCVGLGRLLAFRKAGTLYYVGTDHLGSTIRVADTSFNAVDGMRYKPFGGDRDAGTNLKTDHKYTSQIEDASIDLYWYASRAYDPAIGRFVAPDTMVPNPGNPQSLNRYSYALNNPVRYSDPTGHDIFEENPEDEGWQDEVPAPEYSEPSADVWTEFAGWVDSGPPASGGYESAGEPGVSALDAALAIADSVLDVAGAVANAISSPMNLGNDLLGAAAAVASGGTLRFESGALVAENVRGPVRDAVLGLAGGRPNAVTVGHVILNSEQFDQTTELGAKWMAHEQGHVLQAELLGPAYLPLYGALAVVTLGQRDWHPMEIAANLYRDVTWRSYMR